MKRQTRPVIVEVKRKRGIQERGRSIWGGIDLAAVAVEMANEPADTPYRPLVDSDIQSRDLASSHQRQAEQHMADPQEADTTLQDISETPAIAAEKPQPKKRAPRARKANKEPQQEIATDSGKPAARAKRKIHTDKERAEKLARIERSISGGASIKSAVRQASVSEQTYYQWKKAAAPAPTGDGLKDLLALEAENERLKKMLADRLRKENAELKKKLGLE